MDSDMIADVKDSEVAVGAGPVDGGGGGGAAARVGALVRRYRRVLWDGMWAGGGQAATAVGTLIGVRVLTHFVKPDVYGTVTLVIGIATFLRK